MPLEKDGKMMSSLSVSIWVMIYTIDFACGLCTSDTISAAQHAVVRRLPAHGARRLQLRGGEGWNGALVMRDLYGKAIKLGRDSYSPFTLNYIISFLFLPCPSPTSFCRSPPILI